MLELHRIIIPVIAITTIRGWNHTFNIFWS